MDKNAASDTNDFLDKNFNARKTSVPASEGKLVSEILEYLDKIGNYLKNFHPFVNHKLSNLHSLKRFFQFTKTRVNDLVSGSNQNESELIKSNNPTFNYNEDNQVQVKSDNLVNSNDEESGRKFFDLNQRQIEILNYIRNFDKFTMLDISNKFKGVSERTLRRDMDKLELIGFVVQVGKTRDSYYIVNK